MPKSFDSESQTSNEYFETGDTTFNIKLIESKYDPNENKEFNTDLQPDVKFSINDLVKAPNLRSFIVLLQEYSKDENGNYLKDKNHSVCALSEDSPDVGYFLKVLFNRLSLTDPAAACMLPVFACHSFMDVFVQNLMDKNLIEINEDGIKLLAKTIEHIVEVWLATLSKIGIIEFTTHFYLNSVQIFKKSIKDLEDKLSKDPDNKKLQNDLNKLKLKELAFKSTTTYNIIPDLFDDKENENQNINNEKSAEVIKTDSDGFTFQFGDNYSSRKDN